jgi:hypothetical protein
LTVPRTWDEYNEVAKAVHGRQFDNATLVGSCVGRVKDFAGPYWANLVISSMTQTRGQFEGHLFSTEDLHPLTGPAIEQALEWMEGQVKYGMEGGTCVSRLVASSLTSDTGCSHKSIVGLRLHQSLERDFRSTLTA